LPARHGATIRTDEEVVRWSADGDGVSVETTSGRFAADRLVVTIGPWAAELLADLQLPLRVERTVNGFFRPERPDHWSVEHGAPTFLLDVPEGSFYGIPAEDGVGLKIGLSGGSGRSVTTARTIRREIDDAEIDLLRGVLDCCLPGASGPEVRRITCICTYTPDRDFVVDRHPAHGNVVVGCGFSGRGYKFAPVVGEILADLALEGRTRYDISFLSAGRFAGAAQSAGAPS
jgi:sarcosine oxidase